MTLKTCDKCKQARPLENFKLERGSKSRRKTCNACRHAREKLSKQARFNAALETAPTPETMAMAPPPVFREETPRVAAVSSSADLERVLIIPDTHAPYHDERAWQVMLGAARAFKPRRIIVLGDFLDCYAVSDHTKDPKRSSNLKWEFQQGALKRADLDSLGATFKRFIKGNHEDRLDRFLATHAGPVHDMVDFDSEMGLTANGWQITPYKQGYDLGHVSFTHDTGSAGANAHRQSMNVYHGSVVIGHTHRMAYEVVGSNKGKRILAAMLGWLGDFGAIDYVHKQKALRDWVHGFGVGYFEPSTGLVFVQPVPIVNYECVLNGVKYKANW